jgi:predicted unusual protein kinase regulating ubiquinone biosynthesis (AarF/ABC1/UbiB family)
MRLVVPGLDAQDLIREVRERLLEELDYRLEAGHQRRFAEVFALDPDVRVPAVLASAPKVMVSEWLSGPPLAGLLNRPVEDAADRAERDRLAVALVTLLFSSPARVGRLHADPHPGNFLLQPDGRIGMIDFGAVALLPDGIPPALGRILRLAADRRADALMDLLREQRFVVGEVTPEDVLRWLGGLADPLRSPSFHFTRDWIGTQGDRVANITNDAFWKTGRALNLPAEHMLIARVTGGWLNILAQLDCTVPARGLAAEWVPGFGQDASNATGPPSR